MDPHYHSHFREEETEARRSQGIRNTIIMCWSSNLPTSLAPPHLVVFSLYPQSSSSQILPFQNPIILLKISEDLQEPLKAP